MPKTISVPAVQFSEDFAGDLEMYLSPKGRDEYTNTCVANFVEPQLAQLDAEEFAPLVSAIRKVRANAIAMLD